jgi:hypothetical protein
MEPDLPAAVSAAVGHGAGGNPGAGTKALSARGTDLFPGRW